MAQTTFSGPLRVGRADVNAAHPLLAVATVDVQAVATANTDFTVTLPRCRILRATVLTNTAYTGATATLQVGTTAGGAQVIAATDVKTPGANATALSLVSAFINTVVADGATLTARLVQTTPTAVGTSKLMIEFVPLA